MYFMAVKFCGNIVIILFVFLRQENTLLPYTLNKTGVGDHELARCSVKRHVSAS